MSHAHQQHRLSEPFRIAAGQLAFKVATLAWWKLLPREHPARIYMAGSNERRACITKVLRHDSQRIHRYALIVATTLAWFVVDAAAHRLHLNPLESMFDWI